MILICISQITFHVLFHVLICHQHILFDGMSLYIFWSFSYQIILFFFFLLLLLELFIQSIYYSFVVYLVCGYFLLLYNLSFMSFFVFSAFRKVFNKVNIFNLMISHLFVFMDCAFVVKSRNSLKTLNSKDILLLVFFFSQKF